MTETTTAKRAGLAWQVARQLLPPGPTRARPDWPDAFSPVELAALQYPRPQRGTLDTAARERQGLIAALLASIKAGELVADTEQRTHTLQHGRRTAVSAYLAGENPRPRATLTPAAIQTDVPVITRPAFVAWHHAELAAPAPSVHVLAWLGSEWQAAPEPDSGKPSGKVGEIPGKLPPVACGRLAIKAAWKIECQTERRASAKEVMATLRAWADTGQEPEVLIRSLAGHDVEWLAKGIPKPYGLEACQKTLTKWYASRQ